jgi:hypothetical protein
MKILWLAVIWSAFIYGADGQLRSDGSINGPGVVAFEVTREGALEEDLRVQAMILGHGAKGALEELLVSESIEVIPSGPSRTELTVSEEKFREWKQRFSVITTGLKVVPRPGSKREWEYENTLDPKKDKSVEGRFQVRGRWTAR